MTSLSSPPTSTAGAHGWLWDGAYMKPLALPPPANSTVRLRPLVVGHRGKVFRHAALIAPDGGGATVLAELRGRRLDRGHAGPARLCPSHWRAIGIRVVVAGADAASPVGAAAVMAWQDGQWRRLGDSFLVEGGGGGILSAVISHRGRLLAAGNFHQVGGKAARFPRGMGRQRVATGGGAGGRADPGLA